MSDFLVSFPGLNILDLPVNRIAFQFSLFGQDLTIYWYGILIAAAFLICMLLSLKQSSDYLIDPDQISEVYLAIIPLSLIGARLYYVAFAWSEFAGNPARIFDTRTGGLAFYGGVIGGVIAVLIWSKIRKIRVSRVVDFLIVYVPLGQAIGRWGNFFNQEAFGTNTTLPWGMISNGTSAYLRQMNIQGVSPDLPVHPTFFYEFIANLIIFGILFYVRKNTTRPLTALSWYLILYGLVRFFVEGVRTDALYIADTSIRVSQLLSAAMVLAGLLLLLVMRNRRHKQLETELKQAASQQKDESIDIVE